MTGSSTFAAIALVAPSLLALPSTAGAVERIKCTMLPPAVNALFAGKNTSNRVVFTNTLSLVIGAGTVITYTVAGKSIAYAAGASLQPGQSVTVAALPGLPVATCLATVPSVAPNYGALANPPAARAP